MARCEEGYRCDICGVDVEAVADSGLYLRFVIGEVRPEQLHLHRERHIRCHPEVSQYIVDPGFEPVRCDGPFAKGWLDGEYVSAQEALVTRGWRRLQDLPSLGLPIADYPLPEVLAAWQAEDSPT